MAIFDVWIGWYKLFLSVNIVGSLPSSFWSREYMVWKKMLVEEFQDGCIVHGHIWCANGVILAISESPYCWKPSINFLFKRIYGFIRRCWLKNSKMALKCMAIFDVWMGWYYLFLSLQIARSLPSSFWSREYMVWKEMVVEESQYICLVHGLLWCVNGIIFAFSE